MGEVERISDERLQQFRQRLVNHHGRIGTDEEWLSVCRELAACREREQQPIPMLLFCPQCGHQHIDEPEPAQGWDNPPHKSHTCRPATGGCGIIWRPADVPTTGVAAIQTRGKADTWNGKTRDQQLAGERAAMRELKSIATRLYASCKFVSPLLHEDYERVMARLAGLLEEKGAKGE